MKAVRIVYEDNGPDELGRRTFFTFWKQDGRQRGQIFKTFPQEHIAYWKRQGYQVTEEDKAASGSKAPPPAKAKGA